MENFFTPDNWNYVQYKNNEQFAIISLMADPGILDEGFKYCVTLLDEEHNELFQEFYDTIDAACLSINATYKDYWEFVDLRSKNDGDGCSSCIAH